MNKSPRMPRERRDMVRMEFVVARGFKGRERMRTVYLKGTNRVVGFIWEPNGKGCGYHCRTYKMDRPFGGSHVGWKKGTAVLRTVTEAVELIGRNI